MSWLSWPACWRYWIGEAVKTKSKKALPPPPRRVEVALTVSGANYEKLARVLDKLAKAGLKFDTRVTNLS